MPKLEKLKRIMTFGAVPSLHGPQGQTSLLPCSRWLL